MDKFRATHVIQTGTQRTYVHGWDAEDGPAGSLILYTEREWDNAENADWTYDPDDGLQFQGSTSHPICDGASIEPFAKCSWTRVDGWNDDGTRTSEARP